MIQHINLKSSNIEHLESEYVERYEEVDGITSDGGYETCFTYNTPFKDTATLERFPAT